MKYMKFLSLFLLTVVSSSVSALTTQSTIKTIEIGAGNAIYVTTNNQVTTMCASPNYNYYYVVHPDAIYGEGSMDRMLSLLLAAKARNSSIHFTLNGCSSVGPYVRHIKML